MWGWLEKWLPIRCSTETILCPQRVHVRTFRGQQRCLHTVYNTADKEIHTDKHTHTQAHICKVEPEKAFDVWSLQSGRKTEHPGVALHYTRKTQYIWNVFSPKLSWKSNHLKVSSLDSPKLSTSAREITFKERFSKSTTKYSIFWWCTYHCFEFMRFLRVLQYLFS